MAQHTAVKKQGTVTDKEKCDVVDRVFIEKGFAMFRYFRYNFALNNQEV